MRIDWPRQESPTKGRLTLVQGIEELGLNDSMNRFPLVARVLHSVKFEVTCRRAGFLRCAIVDDCLAPCS